MNSYKLQVIFQLFLVHLTETPCRVGQPWRLYKCGGSISGHQSRLHHDSMNIRMPYVLIRESYLCTSSTVEGLPSNEARILAEKCCSYPDLRDEKIRRLDFHIPSLLILNCLEQLGYRVVTSGSFVASQVKRKDEKLTKKFFNYRVFPQNLFRKNLFGHCTDLLRIYLSRILLTRNNYH